MKATEQGKVSRFRIPIMVGFFALSSLMFIGMASIGILYSIVT